MSFFLLLLHNMVFSAIPAVGFGLVFNVPANALKYCALCGAMRYTIRTVLMHFGFSIELASFLAATGVGMLGIYWSQRLLAHPKVFTVAAIIPMIPGVFAFKAMIALVEINRWGYSEVLWESFMSNGITSLFVLGALAIGLSMPGLLFYRRKPVV